MERVFDDGTRYLEVGEPKNFLGYDLEEVKKTAAKALPADAVSRCALVWRPPDRFSFAIRNNLKI